MRLEQHSEAAVVFLAASFCFILTTGASGKNIWPLKANVSSNMTVYEGEDATFYCIVTNDKNASIHWLRIEQDENEGDRPQHTFLQSADGSPEILTLHDVRPADAGQYTCLIGNEFGSRYKHMYLTVKVPTTATTTTPTSTLTTRMVTTTIQKKPKTEKKKDKKKRKDKKRKKDKKKKKDRQKEKEKGRSSYEDPYYDEIQFSDTRYEPHLYDKDNLDFGTDYTPKYNSYGKTKNYDEYTAWYPPTDTREQVSLIDLTIYEDEYPTPSSNNETAKETCATSGGISVYTVYILVIVGAVAGGLLLARL